MLDYTFTKPDTLVLRGIKKAYKLLEQKQDGELKIAIQP